MRKDRAGSRGACLPNEAQALLSSSDQSAESDEMKEPAPCI